MNRLQQTPSQTLMAMRASARTAPGERLSPETVRARMLGARTLGDDAPRDYAADVGRMIESARSPIAIASGILGGAGAAYGITRLRRQKPRPILARYLVPALGGLFAGTITHGAASWFLYQRSQNPIADTPGTSQSPTSATDRETALMTRALYHPLSIGAGIGTTAASGYGLWKWRNPPGQKKTRWGIPVFGALIAGGMAQSLAASVVRHTQSGEEAQQSSGPTQLAGVTDFSSVGSTIMTAAVVVGVFGGAKYLVDTWPASWRMNRRSERRTAGRTRRLSDHTGYSHRIQRAHAPLPLVTP